MILIPTMRNQVSNIFIFNGFLIPYQFVSDYLFADNKTFHIGAPYLESMDGEINADGLFKLLRQNIGQVQNWHPTNVQRKFVLESNKIFQSKQSLLRGTIDFIKEERFLNALKCRQSFLACVLTQNISSDGYKSIDEMDNADNLSKFLCVDYAEQYIWVVGRCRSDPKKPLDRYCKDNIAILDLNFGADRENPIKAICPISDIITLIMLEDKQAVSILFHKDYLRTRVHRNKKYLNTTTKYRSFFKNQVKDKSNTNKSNENKENQDPTQQQGPSGLNQQSEMNQPEEHDQPDSSESNHSKEPRSNVSNSAVRNEPFRRGMNTNLLSSQSTTHTSDTTTSQRSTTRDTRRLESSDESDDDNHGDNHGDKTRKIVFRHSYAEITSHGVTKKIEIADSKTYRERISKVGFQIDFFFSLF